MGAGIVHGVYCPADLGGPLLGVHTPEFWGGGVCVALGDWFLVSHVLSHC